MNNINTRFKGDGTSDDFDLDILRVILLSKSPKSFSYY